MNFESPSMPAQPLIYELNGTKINLPYWTWLNEISLYKKDTLASVFQEFKAYLEIIWVVVVFHFLFIKNMPQFFFTFLPFIIYWGPTVCQLLFKKGPITFASKLTEKTAFNLTCVIYGQTTKNRLFLKLISLPWVSTGDITKPAC